MALCFLVGTFLFGGISVVVETVVCTSLSSRPAGRVGRVTVEQLVLDVGSTVHLRLGQHEVRVGVGDNSLLGERRDEVHAGSPR